MSCGSEGPHDHQYSNQELVKRLLALAWGFKSDCILSILLSCVLLLLAVLGLQFLGLTVDVIRHALDPVQNAPRYPFGWQPPAKWDPLRMATVLSLAIVAQAIARSYLTYLYNMVTARLTQAKIVPDLRSSLYAKLQRLSFGFYHRHGSSSIFNRVTGDTQNTRLFIDGVLLQGLNMLVTLVVYGAFMWRIHPALTLACLSFTIGLWASTHYYSARLRPAYMRNRELTDQLVLIFTESVRGMLTVKGFAAEAHQIRRFEQANDAVSDQQRAIFRDLSNFTPVTQFLSQFSLVVLFAYGGWLYVHDQIPLGSGLVVFAGLLQQFNGQVVNITNIANSVQQSFTAARRVFEVLDTPPLVQSRQDALRVPDLVGNIVFENVSFAYQASAADQAEGSSTSALGSSSASSPVLRGVTFYIAPGEVAAIFGMTGSGKTSLLALIPRFYDPSSGRILADGWDIRDLDLDAYRRQIGIVYQESFLFSNTVAANIAFGHPKATQDQIERAARMASAHEFIQALPRGYETVLGESGVDLSGGQRQRLALARALLLEPRILILDDPTASVDPRTEREIIDALRIAMRGRTTFVVSNRISLCREADQILVLEHGKLTARGTHDQLMAGKSPYRTTALLQLADEPAGEQHSPRSPSEIQKPTAHPPRVSL